MTGKTALPDDFCITESMREWARTKVPEVDIDAQHELFCDHWRGNGKRMADWTATWRNWMRRAPEFTRKTSSQKTRWRPEGLH